MFTTDNVENYNYNNDKIWSLQHEEIGLVMWERGKTRDLANTNPKKVHIATIMGQENPDGDPKIVPESINPSIYINDTPCKPMVSSSVSVQNYITISHYDNDYFQHKWLDNHAQMKIEIRNGDIDDMHITDHLDNSYCEDETTEHPSCHPFHVCR